MPASQREELLLRRQQVQVLRAPLGLADQARAAVQWLARNPEWPLGVALVIVLLRPRRALRWASYAWQGFSAYRRVQRLMARERPPMA
jgi:hypothetical protein